MIICLVLSGPYVVFQGRLLYGLNIYTVPRAAEPDHVYQSSLARGSWSLDRTTFGYIQFSGLS